MVGDIYSKAAYVIIHPINPINLIHPINPIHLIHPLNLKFHSFDQLRTSPLKCPIHPIIRHSNKFEGKSAIGTRLSMLP
jgi:hypothetical protein